MKAMLLQQKYVSYIEKVWLVIRIHAWEQWEFILERKVGARMAVCKGQAKESVNEKPVETFNQGVIQ